MDMYGYGDAATWGYCTNEASNEDREIDKCYEDLELLFEKNGYEDVWRQIEDSTCLHDAINKHIAERRNHV